MADAWELLIEPRQRPVGTGHVDRLLPFRARRMVGPFIFADLMGPEDVAPTAASGVGVHPHIGLATVTNLFQGAMVHRDSTGVTQEIRPGDVNWMTAGAGVTHSERFPERSFGDVVAMAGLQTWVALPDGDEDIAPSFTHAAAADVPHLSTGTATTRLVAGAFDGVESPIPAFSPLFYTDTVFEQDGEFVLPATLGERAVIPIDGYVRIGGSVVPNRNLAVFTGADTRVEADAGVRVICLGGEPVGERFIDWNFVATSKQRLAEARDRWREFDFPLVDGDDVLLPYP